MGSGVVCFAEDGNRKFHYIAERMLEIFVVLVALIGLAKKLVRRRRFNLRRVRITPEIAIGTLATDTALTSAISNTSPSAYRAISVIATWALAGVMDSTEGPLTVGYAHSDYTVAEIKECLEAAASIDMGNKIAMEQGNRLIRIVGVLPARSGGSFLNDGKPIKTRLNWLITQGDTVNVFVFNENTAVFTTGAVLNLQGDLWIKDSV